MNNAVKTWMKDTGVRIVKTMAETALAIIGTSTAIGEVDWKLVASSVALSGVITILFNIKKIPVKEVVDHGDTETR